MIAHPSGVPYIWFRSKFYFSYTQLYPSMDLIKKFKDYELDHETKMVVNNCNTYFVPRCNN